MSDTLRFVACVTPALLPVGAPTRTDQMAALSEGQSAVRQKFAIGPIWETASSGRPTDPTTPAAARILTLFAKIERAQWELRAQAGSGQ